MSQVPDKFDQLRDERDRFVAFAFAAADLLLEVDSHYRIQYAAGATQALLGIDSVELIGTGALDLIAVQDRERFRLAITTIPTGSRMTPLRIHLCDIDDAVVVTGFHMPDLEDRYFIAVSHDRRPAAAKPAKPVERDEETGLLDSDSFGEVVSERIEAARDGGQNLDLTLFDLKQLGTMRGRVDGKIIEKFVNHVGDALRRNSVDGDSAGRFDDDTYGVLHEHSLDVDALRSEISAYSRHIDPDGVGFDARASTVNVEADNISPEDTARAVVYTINKFTNDQSGEFTISNLSEGCEMMVSETVAKIAEFKTIVREGQFDFALQPIIALKTRKIHHYEALARFDKLGSGSPFTLITFAEEVGVISEFDFAMVKRALDMLAEAEDSGVILSIAVNLSGRSLSNPPFISSLLALLKEYPRVRDRMLFEITESAKITDLQTTNNVIQCLRSAGHSVCLDDFGAGSAAFQYLRALEVDVVKIDGIYVREALTTPNGGAFLQAMVDLCRSLKIDVVAEMVEDEATADFVLKCGVQYAQGFLFGKPTMARELFQPRKGVVVTPPAPGADILAPRRAAR